ncbi:MAG: hypothetical protein QW590_00550 [Candidatus Bilamarchaeaceae archaeon]
MKIIESKPIPASEAKELLEQRKKEGELNYEQTLALEHAERVYSDLKVKKISELMKKNEKITAEAAIKMIEVNPKTISTLKAILVKEKIELSEEELNEIMKALG